MSYTALPFGSTKLLRSIRARINSIDSRVLLWSVSSKLHLALFLTVTMLIYGSCFAAFSIAFRLFFELSRL